MTVNRQQINMNDDDLNQLIDAFTAETQEFLQSMETNLLAMESAELKKRSTLVKEMLRATHSIKGAGSMLGFPNVSAAAHTLEDCFVILRDRTDLSALEPARSEERSGGKEGRSRWSPEH